MFLVEHAVFFKVVVVSTVFQAACFSGCCYSHSGLSVIAPTGSQFRVALDQRFGVRVQASWYSACRRASTLRSSPLWRSAGVTKRMRLCRCSLLYPRPVARSRRQRKYLVRLLTVGRQRNGRGQQRWGIRPVCLDPLHRAPGQGWYRAAGGQRGRLL